MKTYHVRVNGTPLEVVLEETPDGLRVAVGCPAKPGPGRLPLRGTHAAKSGSRRRVDLVELVPGWYSLVIDGRSHTLAVATWRTRPWTLLLDGVAAAVEVGRSPRVRSGAGSGAGAAGQVRAPMPGLVVAIQAEPGMAVVPGQPLIRMEAMKMQMEIRATHAGVVREVRVVPGQDVAGNDLLVTVE